MRQREHRATKPLPSDAELKILRQLWVHGELTVREVHEHVQRDWPVGYTTVLKLLQRMLEKRLVVRTEESRAHRYRARAHQDPMQRRLVRDLLDRAFSGSLSDMMQAALPAERATNAELEEIRRLLARLEEAE